MPVARLEPELNHQVSPIDENPQLLNEIIELLEDINNTQKDIDKIEAKINKLEDSKNHGIISIEQGMMRLQLAQKKTEAMKESVSAAEKKRLDAIRYWEDFGFEARLLPSAMNQSIKNDENQPAPEHYEFIYSKLHKRQSRPYHIGIRHKNKKLNILFAHPETCLNKDQIDQLNHDLNEADFNKDQINWRQTMLTIRKALIRSP